MSENTICVVGRTLKQAEMSSRKLIFDENDTVYHKTVSNPDQFRGLHPDTVITFCEIPDEIRNGLVPYSPIVDLQEYYEL